MQDQIVLKNVKDMVWEKMLPDLGDDSPIYSILRVDPITNATTLKEAGLMSKSTVISTCQENLCTKPGSQLVHERSLFWRRAGKLIGLQEVQLLQIFVK